MVQTESWPLARNHGVKLRESGMPDEMYWESLFDVELILDRLGIDSRLRDVVELGCGYGTFAIPVARLISGVLRTYDIDPAMVERTCSRVREAGLDNVMCSVRDVFLNGFGLERDSNDACLLFNILHGEEPVSLLKEAGRVIRPAGLVLVIHWRCDIETPRGPNPDIRPRPSQVIEWAAEADLMTQNEPVINLPPWHYGVRLRKR